MRISKCTVCQIFEWKKAAINPSSTWKEWNNKSRNGKLLCPFFTGPLVADRKSTLIYSVFCILYSLLCILYLIFCILFATFCTLNSVFCTMYSVFSVVISGYLWLSLTISNYLLLYVTIFGYLRLSLSNIPDHGASRSRRKQVIAIWNFSVIIYCLFF